MDLLEYANEHHNRVFAVSAVDVDEFIAGSMQSDLVILPPFRTQSNLTLDPDLVHVLKKTSLAGTILVSVCAGAFYLCATGIASSKKVTTHWQLADGLKARYPDVIVRKERVLIDEGRFICAGGITSYQDLSLYLVKKYISVEAALAVAKIFLINPEDRTQLQYIEFNLDVSAADDILAQAQRYINEKFSGEIRLEQISAHCGVTVRTLLRHFRIGNCFTPGAYLQSVRIAHARLLLETTKLPVKTVASQAGYGDLASFTRTFGRLVGLTPGGYRKRFSLQASTVSV